MAKIVIGIDESYTRTGIAVLKHMREPVIMESIDFKGCKNNTAKRRELKRVLSSILEGLLKDYKSEEIKCIIERIRTFSGGHMSTQYLITTGSLVATIIDTFSSYGIPIMSVDTKAWKNAIIGNTKPKENKYGINPNKYPTIEKLKMLGMLKYFIEPYKGRGTKGVVNIKINGVKTPCKINDDIADAYCIASYGFLHPSMQKLKEENF